MAPKAGVQNLMAQTRQLAQANLEVRAVLRKGGNARMRVRDPNGKEVLTERTALTGVREGCRAPFLLKGGAAHPSC